MTRKVLSLLNVTRILAAVAFAAGAGLGAQNLLADGHTKPQTQQAAPAKKADTRAQQSGPGRGGPPGQDVWRWWKAPEVVKEVGLNPAQVAKIDKIYEHRKRSIMLKVDEYNVLKAELDQLFRGRTAKPEEVENQARRLAGPSQEIIVSRTRMLYEMAQVMTAEQNDKLRELERRDRERGRGPGPGGNPAPR